MRIHRGLSDFIQLGTGAVSRSLRDKSRERISVKDFGATGDGATDDTAAIQAAYDAIVSGDILEFPGGDDCTYLISAQLDFSDSKHIVIQGHAGATILVTGGAALGTAPSYGAIKLAVAGSGRKVMRDLIIQRSATPGAAIANDHGIVMGPVQNVVRLDNIEIANMGAKGIWIRGTTAPVMITNVYCHLLCYDYAIVGDDSSGGGCQNVSIRGGALFNTLGGVHFDTGDGNAIEDVDIEGDSSGLMAATHLPAIYLEDTSNTFICGKTLARLSATSPAGTIALNNAKWNRISAGLVNAQVANQHGIYIDGTSEGNLIGPLTINGAAGTGYGVNHNGTSCVRNGFLSLNIAGFGAGHNRVYDVAANQAYAWNTPTEYAAAANPVWSHYGTLQQDNTGVDYNLVDSAGDVSGWFFKDHTTDRLNIGSTKAVPHFRASIVLKQVAYASLPTPEQGMLIIVTDSNTAVWGATIAAGGANVVLAYYDGTNWTVAGK